jgi:hypothetical protein
MKKYILLILVIGLSIFITYCQNSKKTGFVSLHPLATQSDESNVYDFIYVLGASSLPNCIDEIRGYADTFQFDTTILWSHDLTFIAYENGLPFDYANNDEHWLGTDRYRSKYLLSIYFSKSTNTYRIYTYKNGEIEKEKIFSNFNLAKKYLKDSF